MSWWSTLVKGAEEVPGEFWSAVKQYPQQIWKDLQVTAGAPESYKDPGPPAPKQAPPQPQATGNTALYDFLMGKVGQLTYGQANTPSQQLINQLSQDVEGMSPTQAQALMKALPGNLGADVQKATSPPTTNDALNMGLQMYFQQYLAPQMQAVNQANQATIGSYQNMMNNALQQNLPPGVKNVLQGWQPLMGELNTQLNTAAYNAAANTIPYQNFLTGVGGLTSAIQGLEAAVPKAAATQAYGSGTGSALGSTLQQQIGTNNQFGNAIAQLLQAGGTSGIPGLTGGTPSPSTLTPTQIQTALQQNPALLAQLAAMG